MMINEETYILLLKIFLALMPVELCIVSAFSYACVKTGDTNQPAFWYALLCLGVLIPEILRGILILKGDIPPHRKELHLWVVELLPFGGFVYEIAKRYIYKVWVNLH